MFSVNSWQDKLFPVCFYMYACVCVRVCDSGISQTPPTESPHIIITALPLVFLSLFIRSSLSVFITFCPDPFLSFLSHLFLPHLLFSCFCYHFSTYSNASVSAFILSLSFFLSFSLSFILVISLPPSAHPPSFHPSFFLFILKFAVFIGWNA